MYGSSPYGAGELAAIQALGGSPKKRRMYGEQFSPDLVGDEVASNVAVQDSAIGAAGTKGGSVVDADVTAASTPAAKGGAGAAGGGGGTAALIALQLYSQAKKAQFADKKARYDAHLDQRNAMSNALDSLIGTTRQLRL